MANCVVCQRASVTAICYACAAGDGESIDYAKGQYPDAGKTFRDALGLDAAIDADYRARRGVRAVKAVAQCAAVPDPQIEEGDGLRALVEAELLLSAHYSERHGCNCGRHLQGGTSERF